LHIAFLTPEYVSEPKFDGGLANYLFRLTRMLRQEGHDPEVFVTAGTDETISHEGIPVHRCRPARLLAQVDRVQRTLLRKRYLPYMDAILTAEALARALRRRHRVKPFDVVEASNFKATGLLAKGPRSPAMVVRVSYALPLWDQASGTKPYWERKVRHRLEDLTLRRADLAYGPCTRLAQFFTERVGRPVDVIHPPLFPSVGVEEEDDSVWRNQLQGCRFVLFFGRICLVKGADILARAMRPILSDEEQLRLVMVGRPEQSKLIGTLRDALGDQRGKLLHVNRLPHRQLFPLIRNAECVALPSRVDNFPNTCVEAMALGQIVIGTRGTGFEDLIDDGQNGFLVGPSSDDDLEKVLRRALSMTPEQKASVQAKARQRIYAAEPISAAQELIQYYAKAIAVRAGRVAVAPLS
jgi:glycosyltransferase involved in cell wall biosynthesis